MLIGREPDAAVLGEASAWMLARSVASASADPRLVELDASLDRVTGAVLALSRALAENVADSRDVQAFARDFLAMEGLPIEAPRKRTDFESFTTCARRRRRVPAAARPRRRLCGRQARARLRRVLRPGRVGPRDLRAASRGRRGAPASAPARCCSTSTRTPASCRPGCWRPCSAVTRSWPSATPTSRSTDGAAPAPPTSRGSRTTSPTSGAAAGVYDLSTSWRNPGVVLDAANAIIEPLDAGIPKAPLVPSPVRRRRTRRDRLGRDDRGGGRSRRPLVRRATPCGGRSLRSQRCVALPHLRERRRLHRGTAPRTACRCTCSASPACSTSR